MQQQQSFVTNSNLTELLALAKESAETALKYDTELNFNEAVNKYIEAIENLTLAVKCKRIYI